jgi:hypothetical protein
MVALFFGNTFRKEAPRTGVNASHFGVQVANTEDVAQAWTRFKEAGLRTFTEEDTECCYAMQDKVWIEDPDGNAWEVFFVKSDAENMGTATAGPLAAAPCCAPKIGSKGSDGGCCG